MPPIESTLRSSPEATSLELIKLNWQNLLKSASGQLVNGQQAFICSSSHIKCGLLGAVHLQSQVLTSLTQAGPIL